MTEATTWRPSGEVKDLTDRPRLPRLGKVHLGVKKLSQRGNEYPSATDYLVCPPSIQSVYGEKPRELDIVLPSDDVAQVAGVAWKSYSATRGKVCTSDGEHAARLIDVDRLPRGTDATQDEYDAALVSKDSKNVEWRKIPCPAHDCVFAKKGVCKPVMNLLFMVPKAPGIGVFQLDTGSINSIRDIRGGIELVRKLSGGRLAGIPLKLRLEPMEVISPEDQKKKVVFTLKLISPATLGRVLMAGERNLRELLMADNPETPQVALPAPGDVPEPVEPEEDLYPASQIVSSPVAPTAARDDAGHEGPAPADPPSPTGPPDDMALAADVEQLFSQLETPSKDRQLYRNGYRGRTKALRDMLKRTLATKTQGGKK